MNRKKLEELLGDAASKDVIDSIMAANGDDINKAKGAATELNAKLAEAQAQIESLQSAADANKTESQKWQDKIDAANAAAAKAIHALNEQSAVAVFAKAGISEDEYKPLLGSIVSDDRKKTTSAAEAIAAIVSAKVDAAVEQAKKSSLGSMTPPAGGQDGQITTKAQFKALSDAQQIEWKSQNPEAWQKLS